MARQKYIIGQIVRYTGPDLVAYEQGKTYTVLGYDKKLDLYEIMSELDEAYLLPEDVMKPLSKGEEKEIRISDRMLEYYQSEGRCVKGSDFDAIDEKRLMNIIKIANDDVKNSRLKKDRDYFANDSEYRLYLSDLFDCR